MIKLIAFDIFGTIFDLSKTPKNEIREYGEHIRKPEWSPLKLPKSWENLDAHGDCYCGLSELRSMGYIVVTLSNGPLGLQTKLSKNNGIVWDAITPLEINKVFKPNPRAYESLCEIYDFQPNEIMMVTANKTFGDLEASAKLGMRPCLIRDKDGECIDVVDLYEKLYKEKYGFEVNY